MRAWSLSGIVLAALVACQDVEHEGAAEARETLPMDAPGGRPDYPSEQSREQFRSLMQEKAATADSLLRDVLYGDYIGIAGKAASLRKISLQAEMERLPSPERARLAENFRSALQGLIENAEMQSTHGLLESHAAMNRACLECHLSLREESSD